MAVGLLKAMSASMLLLLPLSFANARAEGENIIGLSEPQLISCAGIPSATMNSGGATYFQYEYFVTSGSASSWFNDGDYVIRRRKHGCTALVTLQGGRVTNVTFKKSGAIITRWRACNRIFESC